MPETAKRKSSPKRKSNRRFEQLNRLVDEVCPQLPGTSHVAILMVCWRHAREAGHFQASTKRIARSAGLKERQAKRIIDDLEAAGVIEMTKEHNGPVPRCYRITGKVPNGVAHDTNNIINARHHAPQANGVMGDR
ncbi:helix-turn-helix domain-containing protein [Rosistilla oblonga]|uniref:helix-turn-helix domain-containing protein n=1 Tax=Rosistilla oblonga TaxID=2527990 RepID=UPI003B8A6E37